MYKDNLMPSSLSEAIVPLVSDKTERILLHIIFALFLKFGLRYLSIYFWNSEIDGLLERRP